MTNSNLKIIACIIMLIDHIGAIFFPEIIIFRIIGRIAFPIFCFLIVEGYYHTSNIKRYLFRLGIFALISEIPFDLAFFGKLFYFRHQNVFITLFLGLFAIYFFDITHRNTISGIFVVLISVLNTIIGGDYGLWGIIIIFGFYVFKDSYIKKCICLILINVIIVAQQVYAYGGIYPMIIIQLFAILAIPFIYFYNGKKGKSLKYVFYVFYPGHLLILYLMNFFAFK